MDTRSPHMRKVREIAGWQRGTIAANPPNSRGGTRTRQQNTVETGQASQSGSDLAQSEWILEFTVRLTEAGFTDDQVEKILEAAHREGSHATS